MRAISFVALLLRLCRFTRGAQPDIRSSAQLQPDPYVAVGNTCSAQPQYFYLPEFGYAIEAPTVVYRVFNLTFPHPVTFHPRHITLSPHYVDLSIWVCSAHQGNTLANCIDGSDNGWNAVNQVTIPAQAGGWYVVISGNIDGSNPDCGNFTSSTSTTDAGRILYLAIGGGLTRDKRPWCPGREARRRSVRDASRRRHCSDGGPPNPTAKIVSVSHPEYHGIVRVYKFHCTLARQRRNSDTTMPRPIPSASDSADWASHL